MISEGSCDTEDWSNDAENSALITGINYILNDKNSSCNNFSQYYSFYCILDQINAALVNIRDFFQKTFKIPKLNGNCKFHHFEKQKHYLSSTNHTIEGTILTLLTLTK